MYATGQIIYDLEAKIPVKMGDVWDEESYPNKHTHFIKATGRFWKGISEYTVYCPKSVAEAEKLLAQNKIAVAPEDPKDDELEYPTVDFNRIKYSLIRALEQLDVEKR